MFSKRLTAGLSAERRVWIVTGEARLLVDRAVAGLVTWGRERCGPPQFNFSAYQASEPNAVSAACSTARTLPMMADLRVVVVKELEAADEAGMDVLCSYAKDPSPSTLLIACGEGVPKTRKGGSNWGVRVPKALEGRGEWIRFGEGEVPPAVFAAAHARELGKELAPEQASLLVELVGGDLGRIVQEVEKVALYVGDEKRISPEALHAACSLLAEAIVWDLTTGIAQKNPDMALRALHRLLEDGDSSHRLVALVLWQMRQVLQVSELARIGLSDNAIRERTGGRGENITRIRRALGGKSLDAAKVLQRIAEANEAMNSHRAGDRRVLEALVMELCTA